MFSPLTAWSWRAEERRNLNALRHLSPLYGEKRFVDKTVTVCRHCVRGLHWDWVPHGHRPSHQALAAGPHPLAWLQGEATVTRIRARDDAVQIYFSS